MLHLTSSLLVVDVDFSQMLNKIDGLSIWIWMKDIWIWIIGIDRGLQENDINGIEGDERKN